MKPENLGSLLDTEHMARTGEIRGVCYACMADTDGESFCKSCLAISAGKWKPGTTVNADVEIRVTDPKTGGQKGRKPEAYALIPAWPLSEVARVYGMGAEKYEKWNWIRGYDWSLSLSAMQRHIEEFRAQRSQDKESGLHHLAHACFHLFALMEFERLNLGTDDRQPQLPGIE